ncbi:hypothetical protein HGRIS_008126 [Hohenbuehelia grisea]|uniref:RxLR effector protein n=1 Tax=Hohenbuehelia grisea TaxID=104357 RepID=A0ABR3J7F7_9AGAR
MRTTVLLVLVAAICVLGRPMSEIEANQETSRPLLKASVVERPNVARHKAAGIPLQKTEIVPTKDARIAISRSRLVKASNATAPADAVADSKKSPDNKPKLSAVGALVQAVGGSLRDTIGVVTDEVVRAVSAGDKESDATPDKNKL